LRELDLTVDSSTFLEESKPGIKRKGLTTSNAQTTIDGDIHTNGIEGFRSLFKQGIIGVYHRVPSKYLQSYLDEFVF